MQIQDLLSFLEEHAPPMYQESYDNAGLIVGDASHDLKGVVLCLDSTEAVIELRGASGDQSDQTRYSHICDSYQPR